MQKAPWKKAQKWRDKGYKDALDGKKNPPKDKGIIEWSAYLQGHEKGVKLRKSS